MVAKLAEWTKQAGRKTSPLHGFNIGPRLTFCFSFIILTMLMGNAILLWQFQRAREQAERLSGIDQELIVVLQAHTSKLAIKSEIDVGQLLISVSDNGVGLPVGQVDQIFRAFFTTKDNGTGMGLPIGRSIIESHGGRLWATGDCGRGATFQFTLPGMGAAFL